MARGLFHLCSPLTPTTGIEMKSPAGPNNDLYSVDLQGKGGTDGNSCNLESSALS